MRSYRVIISLFAFLEQEFLFDSVVKEIPRQKLVKLSFTGCVEIGVDSTFFEYLKPLFEREAISPAVEAEALFTSKLEGFREPSVTSGKRSDPSIETLLRRRRI